MDHQTFITLGGLAAGSVLLIVANWSSVKTWLPRVSLFASRDRDRKSPAQLIDAYHVARDACDDNTDLAARTDQIFKDLICKKVLRCEK